VPTIDGALAHEISLLHNRVCFALGDPKRLLLLYALEGGSRCVGELAADLGLPQPAVSRHLRVLRERSLVTVDRRGPSSYYALADRRLIEAVDLLRGVLAAQLDAERQIERRARAARPVGAHRAQAAARRAGGRTTA
jgi:DNA-binding transcriptional ArsR family regulator